MGNQTAAERKLMRMFNHHKASHILQNHQDVLVNRIYVKQVMLHLPNNFSEGG